MGLPLKHSVQEKAMKNESSYVQRFLETYRIGLKLRALRARKRITLSRLAAETSLSTALLSKLETDRMVPTLSTLSAICRVYGVGLSHFFQEPNRHTLSITRRSHLQPAGHSRQAVKITLLHGLTEGTPLVAQVIEFSNNGAPYSPAVGGKLLGLVYVLEGRLTMDMSAMQETLETGDFAYIEGDETIAWSATGKELCRVLVVSQAPLPAM
jgi:transcriptional regulator with XRE-family HTH domain